MPRTSVMLGVLFAIAYAGLFGYSYATRTAAPRADAARFLAAPDRAPGTGSPTPAPPAQNAETGADSEVAIPLAVSAEVVATWVNEATGDDPERRTAAIAALAMARKSEAAPVLKSLLGNSSDTDKQLALNSLRTLALSQDDADGSIRDVVRQVIYHDSSEAVVSSAQTVLDEVEGGLGKIVPNTIP